MTLVNKTIQVSSVQLCHTSSSHCVVCSPPTGKSLSTIAYPPALLYLSHFPFHLTIITLLSASFLFICLFLLNPSTFFHPAPKPTFPDSCQSVLCIYESVSILFVTLFCSLNSTYEWNHMVLVFLSLAYISIILSRSIQAVTKGKISFFFMAE